MIRAGEPNFPTRLSILPRKMNNDDDNAKQQQQLLLVFDDTLRRLCDHCETIRHEFPPHAFAALLRNTLGYCDDNNDDVALWPISLRSMYSAMSAGADNNHNNKNERRKIKKIRRRMEERKLIRRRIDLFWTQFRTLEARYCRRGRGRGRDDHGGAAVLRQNNNGMDHHRTACLTMQSTVPGTTTTGYYYEDDQQQRRPTGADRGGRRENGDLHRHHIEQQKRREDAVVPDDGDGRSPRHRSSHHQHHEDPHTKRKRDDSSSYDHYYRDDNDDRRTAAGGSRRSRDDSLYDRHHHDSSDYYNNSGQGQRRRRRRRGDDDDDFDNEQQEWGQTTQPARRHYDSPRNNCDGAFHHHHHHRNKGSDNNDDDPRATTKTFGWPIIMHPEKGPPPDVNPNLVAQVAARSLVVDNVGNNNNRTATKPAALPLIGGSRRNSSSLNHARDPAASPPIQLEMANCRRLGGGVQEDGTKKKQDDESSSTMRHQSSLHVFPPATDPLLSITAATAAASPHSASNVSNRNDGCAATVVVTDQSSPENEPSAGQKARCHAIAHVGLDLDEFPEDCDGEGTIPAEAKLVNLDTFEVPDLEALRKDGNDTSMMLKEDREMNRNDSGLTLYSQTRTKRPATTVAFRKRLCDDTELGKYVRTRLARWEPFWKIETLLSEGITSPVASSSPYLSTICTATDIEFLITRRTLGEKYQEFIDTLSKESVEEKDLDLDLILWMLPVIRPKSDKADCHLWPKGTFLQLNGKPTWLQQRYEYTANKWKGTCAPLRLARHMTKNATKEIQRIQVVSADDTTFLFVVALCRYHSNLRLHVSLNEDSAKMSVYTGIKKVKQMTTEIDVVSSNNELPFRLICPLAKSVLVTPVRGKRCNHFQCFDLKSFIDANVAVSHSRWLCPVCEQRVSLYDLEICHFTQSLLSKATTEKCAVKLGESGDYQIVVPEKLKSSNSGPSGKRAAAPSTNDRPGKTELLKVEPKPELKPEPKPEPKLEPKLEPKP